MGKERYWALCVTAPAIVILTCDSALVTGIMMILGGIIASLSIFSWWENRDLIGLNVIFTTIVAIANGWGLTATIIFTVIAAGIQFIIMHALIGAAAVAGNT